MNSILLKPLISEKSLAAQSLDRYTFLVAPGAAKNQVKNTVQDLFKVDVVKVWLKKKGSQQRRTGKKRLLKTDSGQKIAVVQLKKGQKIEAVTIKDKK